MDEPFTGLRSRLCSVGGTALVAGAVGAVNATRTVVLTNQPHGERIGVLLATRREDAYAERHAREALNFNLSLSLYGLVLVVAGTVLLVVVIGLAVLLVAVLYFFVFFFVWLILSIVAAIAASRGDEYTYPLTMRLVS